MNKNNGGQEKVQNVRRSSRAHCLREITVNYEGQEEHTVVKAPDLSATGMFISTNRRFPEGAILNLRFLLATTNAEVRTRCEVRHCLPGVGVGVEFIGLQQRAAEDIARELALSDVAVRHAEKNPPAKPRRRKK